MNLLDNDATASLTERELAMIALLGRCQSYLADLRGGNWISGDSDATKHMRQRATALQRLSGAFLIGPVLPEALFGE